MMSERKLYPKINFARTIYQRATKLMIANQLLSLESATKGIIHDQATSKDNEAPAGVVTNTVNNIMRHH